METRVGRLLTYLVAAIATIAAALTLAYVAHYDFGLSRQEIRTAAMMVAVVIAVFLKAFRKPLRKPPE